MPIASWQMVGSARVTGLRGLGRKTGGLPMPEMMRSVGRSLREVRVWETLWSSWTSP